jgi:hypothetical protein
MPTLRFLGQPMSEQLGVELRRLLERPALRRVWIATAWGKASGLSRLADVLEAAAIRTGDSRIVLGADANGATEEGLRQAIQLFTDARLFFDPGSRTFHPKLYMVEEDNYAAVIVGSGNLTRGGLYTNYEAAVLVEVHDISADVDGRAFLQSVNAYFEALWMTPGACQELNDTTLPSILGDSALRIDKESRSNYRRSRSEQRAATGAAVSSLFGFPVTGLPNAPAPIRPAPPFDDADSDSIDGTGLPPLHPTDVASEQREPDEADVGEAEMAGAGFWKRLSNFDTNPGSAPGQIIIPRRFVDFFPPLTVEQDDSALGGPRQSGVHFRLTFVDGAEVIDVADARAVLYEPAAGHKRRNIELRFTFRDRRVQDRLRAGDELVFTKNRSGDVTVSRCSRTDSRRRFAWL